MLGQHTSFLFFGESEYVRSILEVWCYQEVQINGDENMIGGKNSQHIKSYQQYHPFSKIPSSITGILHVNL